ncbi:FIMAH domain-containing protein [Phytoactinopolyspora limicola]|uniref:FIMAH domain-containing protein n=1 Tax=Phytoactinopolyspora limicola TaxID=2715536 RepID=UPI00140E2FE3|nr:family 10 glycosylhydrolase [Phytoactinopolyspora limicola]
MSATRSVELGSGTWSLRFLAKVASLQSAGDGEYGFHLSVVAGGRKYDVVYGDSDCVSIVNGALGTRDTFDGVVPIDERFHRWQLGVDGLGRFFLELDGQKVAAYDTDISTSTTEPDQLRFGLDPSSPPSGPTEIYLSGLELSRDVATAWYRPDIATVTVLPASDSRGLATLVGLSDVDPRDLSTGSLALHYSLSGDESIAELTTTPTTSHVSAELDPAGHTGELGIVCSLSRGSELLSRPERRWKAPDEAEVVSAGSTISAVPEMVSLLKDIDQCQTEDGVDAVAAGWNLGTFEYDGGDETGLFLDSTESAEPLVVPLSLNGWLSVYVGYLTGTEKFSVEVGGQARIIEIGDAPEFDPDHAFGQRALGEVEAWTGQFTGDSLIIAPVLEAQTRMAYIRVVGLTADETALAAEPDEGPAAKRVVYNNDGLSDFFEGRYKTVPELQEQVVDIYAASDVEALTWTAGTTFLFTHTSEYAGVPYASLTPEQEDLMRDGDKVAMQTILDYVDNDIVPLEVVAARAKHHGLAAFAGLRMDTFYSMASYPWYNGNIWDDYQDSLFRNYNGTTNAARMSYSFAKFRTYIKNVLVELANMADVDGIDMDFCRYPELIGWEPDLLDAYFQQYGTDARTEVTPEGSERWQQFRADVVTSVVQEIRALLPEKTIIARVPHANALAYGLDIAAWVDQELIDVLVPSNISHEQFWDNVDEFADIVAGTNVSLYGGTTHTLSGSDLTLLEQELIKRGYSSGVVRSRMTADMYRERANQFYRAGYDGVYVFNHWRGTESIGVMGDRVRNEKWRVFDLPASWIQGAVTAEQVSQQTVADLMALVRDLTESGDIKRGFAGTLRAQVTQIGRLMQRAESDDVVVDGFDRFIRLVDKGKRADQVSSGAAIKLVAAARLVASRV